MTTTGALPPPVPAFPGRGPADLGEYLAGPMAAGDLLDDVCDLSAETFELRQTVAALAALVLAACDDGGRPRFRLRFRRRRMAARIAGWQQ